MRDLIAELERVRRRVSAGAGHVVELSRSYEASVADLWDACTRPERIARWFLPVTGDLRPGGSYQLEGNAGLLAADFAGLGGGRAELRLRHTVPDDDHWASFGPGAVGVGWDLALLGLAAYLGGEPVADHEAFEASPEAKAFVRRSAAEWGQAHAAAGTPPEVARDAADRTSAAYAPVPESAG